MYYIEPRNLYHSLLGFDMATDPQRLAAMREARDRGTRVALVGKPVVHRSGPPQGLLVFLPVYSQTPPPNTVAERRKKLRGFVLGAYWIDRLAEQAVEAFQREGIVVRLFENTDVAQRQLLYCSQSSAGTPHAADGDQEPVAANRLSREDKLDVAGRRWLIRCTTVAGYVAARRTWLPWIVLAAGLALTAFLATRSLNNVREAMRIEHLVVQRTRELRQSEHDLRTVIDTVQVGIALVDADNQRLIDVNPVAVAMLGGVKEQIVGRNCQALICSARCATCPVLAAGTAIRNRECRLRMANGQTIPVLKTVVPVTLSGKHYMLETFLDISERRRMEDALRASEQKFRTIADSALDAVLMLQPSGNVLHWNPAAERLLGFASEEVLGRPVYRVLAPQHHAYARETLLRIAASGPDSVSGTTVELTGVHKNGAEVPVEVSVAVIPLDNQWGAVVIGRDITARKAAEAELQRRTAALELANRALRDAKQAAEAANLAKSEFLTNMSHELRTPLHGILSFAALGVRRNQTLSPEERLEYFQLIHQSGNTLLQLINTLLDLAKLEAGRLEFNFEQLDLARLVPEVLDELRSLLEDHRLKSEFLCSAPQVQAQGDRMRLLQVIRNLISNAIRFARPGDTIEIEVSERGSHQAVAVRDRGVGIPEDELATVFDKFMQSSKTRTGAGGTGLGLAICREIVQAHGGRIWAENRPGGGAILTFEIPRHRPTALALVSTHEHQNLPHAISG
jgi:PAS domain S-box-containing protein